MGMQRDEYRKGTGGFIYFLPPEAISNRFQLCGAEMGVEREKKVCVVKSSDKTLYSRDGGSSIFFPATFERVKIVVLALFVPMPIPACGLRCRRLGL